MKKVLVASLFLFVIGLLFSQIAQATCDETRDPAGGMCYRPVDCQLVLPPSHYCCDTQSECSSAPTPQPPPPPPSSACPGGIETAVGCVDVSNPTAFVTWFLKLAIGIGGGIAFLLMLLGAFQIMTSSGDPDRLKAGKELITSALMGLLMIIFSVFLLQLIGVKILEIPGF
ncbi:MAG: hypothetical protein ACOZBZ_00965 [Patescibacteria group bacterium]